MANVTIVSIMHTGTRFLKELIPEAERVHIHHMGPVSAYDDSFFVIPQRPIRDVQVSWYKRPHREWRQLEAEQQFDKMCTLVTLYEERCIMVPLHQREIAAYAMEDVGRILGRRLEADFDRKVGHVVGTPDNAFAPGTQSTDAMWDRIEEKHEHWWEWY